MCGRFNVTSDPLQAVFMDLVGQEYPGPDNFNTAPTSQVWIFRNIQNGSLTTEAIRAQWWLVPRWVKEPTTQYAMFNARCENLEKSNAFRTPFNRQRCVVPISGYYEWCRKDGQKQPYYIRAAENSGLLLAGIWDEWIDRATDEILTSFSIVTTEAHRSIKFIHHRQPALLSRAETEVWLNHETERELLHSTLRPSIPYDLAIDPVSSYVGNTRNNGPKCIESIGDSTLIPPS